MTCGRDGGVAAEVSDVNDTESRARHVDESDVLERVIVGLEPVTRELVG